MTGPTSSGLITATSLPLPTGAALNTSVDGVEEKLDALHADIDQVEAKLDSLVTSLTAAGHTGTKLIAIEALLATGATITAIQQITSEIQAMRGQTPVPFAWVGLGAVQFDIGPALTIDAKYEVTKVQWDANDDAAGTTDVQLSIGYATGYMPGASQYELYGSTTLTFVAHVIGTSNLYNTGSAFVADGTGKLYGVATPTGGATTNGTGTIWVRRIY